MGLFSKFRNKDKDRKDEEPVLAEQPEAVPEEEQDEDWDEALAAEAMAAAEDAPEPVPEPEPEPEPEPVPEPEPEPEKKPEKKEKKKGLLSGLFAAFSRVDEDFLEELEERLILADAGVETAETAVEALRKEKGLKGEAVQEKLADILDRKSVV